MKKLRPHPLMILNYLYPFLFVFIIPIVRGALGGADSYTSGRFIKAVALALVCISAVARWALCRIYLFEDRAVIKSGILFKSEHVIPFKNISCITRVHTPLNALFSAVTLRIDTESGKKGKADFSVRVYKRDIKHFTQNHHAARGEKISFWRVVLMSAAASSAGVGALVAAPVIKKAGVLLDLGVSELLIDTVNEVGMHSNGIIPPVVNMVTLVFLALYLVSFVLILVKNLRMRVLLSDKRLSIATGAVIRRHSVFKISSVNAVMLESAPIMRLLRRANLRVSVAGYGVERGESTTLIPALTRSESNIILREFFQIEGGRKNKIKADKGSEWRFIRWYLAAIALVGAAAALLCFFLPPFNDLFVFLALVAVAIIAYLVTLAEHNFKNEMLCTSGNSLYIYAARGFSVCEMYCTKNRVGMVKIRRYPVDLKKHTCNAKITLRNENADSITLKHINYGKAKEYYAFFR